MVRLAGTVRLETKGESAAVVCDVEAEQSLSKVGVWCCIGPGVGPGEPSEGQKVVASKIGSSQVERKVSHRHRGQESPRSSRLLPDLGRCPRSTASDPSEVNLGLGSVVV